MEQAKRLQELLDCPPENKKKRVYDDREKYAKTIEKSAEENIRKNAKKKRKKKASKRNGDISKAQSSIETGAIDIDAANESAIQKTISWITGMSEPDRMSTRVAMPTCASYCFTWLLKGACKSPHCTYTHSTRTQGNTTLPAGTNFKRKGDSFKRRCNISLASLSANIPSKSAFVLDGKEGATCKALKRRTSLVLSPNVDPVVVHSLKKYASAVESTSTATLLGARNYGCEFGTVYLDYMWPLDYFERGNFLLKLARTKATFSSKKRSNDSDHRSAIDEVLSHSLPSLDGFEDITCLFGSKIHSDSKNGNPSQNRCLLSNKSVVAITIVSHSTSTRISQQTRLEGIIGTEAVGRRVSYLGDIQAEDRELSCLFYGIGLDDNDLMRLEVPAHLSFNWERRLVP